ncbi:hypothetical protein ACXWR7_12205, partial [Streptococcus pyogenes]
SPSFFSPLCLFPFFPLFLPSFSSSFSLLSPFFFFFLLSLFLSLPFSPLSFFFLPLLSFFPLLLSFFLFSLFPPSFSFSPSF